VNTKVGNGSLYYFSIKAKALISQISTVNDLAFYVPPRLLQMDL